MMPILSCLLLTLFVVPSLSGQESSPPSPGGRRLDVARPASVTTSANLSSTMGAALLSSSASSSSATHRTVSTPPPLPAAPTPPHVRFRAPSNDVQSPETPSPTTPTRRRVKSLDTSDVTDAFVSPTTPSGFLSPQGVRDQTAITAMLDQQFSFQTNPALLAALALASPIQPAPQSGDGDVKKRAARQQMLPATAATNSTISTASTVLAATAAATVASTVSSIFTSGNPPIKRGLINIHGSQPGPIWSSILHYKNDHPTASYLLMAGGTIMGCWIAYRLIDRHARADEQARIGQSAHRAFEVRIGTIEQEYLGNITSLATGIQALNDYTRREKADAQASLVLLSKKLRQMTKANTLIFAALKIQTPSTHDADTKHQAATEVQRYKAALDAIEKQMNRYPTYLSDIRRILDLPEDERILGRRATLSGPLMPHSDSIVTEGQRAEEREASRRRSTITSSSASSTSFAPAGSWSSSTSSSSSSATMPTSSSVATTSHSTAPSSSSSSSQHGTIQPHHAIAEYSQYATTSKGTGGGDDGNGVNPPDTNASGNPKR